MRSLQIKISHLVGLYVYVLWFFLPRQPSVHHIHSVLICEQVVNYGVSAIRLRVKLVHELIEALNFVRSNTSFYFRVFFSLQSVGLEVLDHLRLILPECNHGNELENAEPAKQFDYVHLLAQALLHCLVLVIQLLAFLVPSLAFHTTTESLHKNAFDSTEHAIIVRHPIEQGTFDFCLDPLV